MPIAKCPICGKIFHGWALLNGYDTCDCGYKLEIIEKYAPAPVPVTEKK